MPRIRPADIAPCDVLFVGEAPGLMEINTGKSFQGPSGDLIHRTVARYLTTEEFNTIRVGITNAVLCHQVGSGKEKKFLSACTKACHDRLVNEVRLRQPRVIIAFGNPALHSLVGDYDLKITKCLGRIFEQPDTGIPVAPVVHPAAVLRQTSWHKDFEKGMEIALQLVTKGRKWVDDLRDPGETTFHVGFTPEILQACYDAPELDCDIETTGFYWRRGDFIRQIGLCYEKNKVVIIRRDDVEGRKIVKSILEGPKPCGWQNGKFDVQFLRNDWGIQAHVDEDSLLLHYVLDERKGTHGLKQRAAQDLGAADYEDALDEYIEEDEEAGYRNVPDDVLDIYNAKDCDYTHQLIKKYRAEINQDPGLKYLYEKVLIPTSELLSQIEDKGVFVNTEYLVSLKSKLDETISSIESSIDSFVKEVWDPIAYVESTKAKSIPKKFNPNSWQQLGWVLYKKLNLKSPKGFGYNTQSDTLERLQPPHPITNLVIEYRTARKLYSLYIAGKKNPNGIRTFIQPDGRVHSTFLLHGTVTGRLASRNPNLQNIPRDSDIRAMFQAPPGRVLIECDYASAELRCLCYLSEDPDLRQIFLDDKDLHDEMSTVIFGEGWTSEQRILAKMVNFGIAYGRGGESIARQFNIAASEGHRMVEKWFQRFPRAAAFLRWIRDKVTRGEVIESSFGRKRRFHLVTSKNIIDLQNEAVNFPVSSLSTDLTSLSACRANPQLKAYDAFLINLVHDSMLAECPNTPAHIQAVASIMQREMVKTPTMLPNGTFVPFKVDIKVGQAWGSLVKYKPT